MWFPRFGRQLRLKQGGNKKAVGLGFNCAGLLPFSASYEWKASFDEGPFEIRVHLEVAKEPFFHHVFPVERMQIRSRANPEATLRPRQFGGTRGTLGYLAVHRRDYDLASPGCVLCRIGVRHAHHVACDFDQRVLKTAASPKKWPVTAPRKLNSTQHTFETFVGASRCGPQAIESFKLRVEFRIEQGIGWQPLRFDRNLQRSRGVLDRFLNPRKSRRRRIELSENTNAYGVCHGFIVTEGRRKPRQVTRLQITRSAMLRRDQVLRPSMPERVRL